MYMKPNRLIDIREEADMKQEEMAQILKTTQSNYSRWENNTEFIPLKKLTLLCNYFDINMDYIFGLTDKRNSNGKHNLDLKTLSKNLRLIRKQNHLTQTDLANLLHTSQSTISAYEAGKTILLTVFAVEICKTYHVSLDWLCGRTK